MDLTEVKIEEEVLYCPDPKCRFNCLHHRGVTIYQRGEDSNQTSITEVGWDAATAAATVNTKSVLSCVLPPPSEGNPSQRRYGLTIQFYCEGCGGDFELCMAQHKGETYLNWRKLDTLREFEIRDDPG